MTTEDGLLLPSRMAKHIDRLRRRVEWLDGRVQWLRDEGRPESDNGFVVAERAALVWAIPVLEAGHMAAIRRARHILAAAGVPEGKRDGMIAAGHPR
jgi:hypothetical protein